MPISPNQHALNPDPASGLNGDEGPVPGDLQVLQGIVDDFGYLRDVGWSVSQGLEAVVTSSLSGGLEGETADALRGVVSGRLKTFVYNVGRAFSLAEEAVAEYRLALAQAQQAVSGLVAQASGMAAKDPMLAGLKQQIHDQRATVVDAEQTMIRALRDAADMVSQPIQMPSVFDKVWQGVELTLGITAMVLTLLSTIVDGPLGIAAFAAGAAGVAMAAADFARHRVNLAGFLMSLTGLLAPETKGLFTLEQVGAAFRGVVAGAAKAAGDTAHVLTSPGAMKVFMMSLPGYSVQALLALSRIPVLVVRGLGTFGQVLPTLVKATPQAVKFAWQELGSAISKDFARVAKWYPQLGSVLSPHGAYVLVALGRTVGALFTPMRFTEMAELGFRGAWAAWSERASLTHVVQGLGKGWRAYGQRVGWAHVEFAAPLHVFESRRTGGQATMGPTLGMSRLTFGHPGPGAGGLGKPVVRPVTGWTVRDLRCTGGFTTGPHELSVPSPAGTTFQGLDVAGTPAVSKLLLSGRTAHGQNPLLLDQLGRIGLPQGEHPRLVDALLPLEASILWEKYAQDAQQGWITTKAGLVAPTLSVLCPGSAEFLDELRPEGVEKLLTGKIETVAGLDDPTVRVGGIPEPPHTESGKPGEVKIPAPHIEPPTAGVDSATLESRVWQVKFSRVQADTLVTVIVPAPQTVVLHEGSAQLGVGLHGEPQPTDVAGAEDMLVTGQVIVPDIDEHGVEFARDAQSGPTVRMPVMDATGIGHTPIWRRVASGMAREVPLPSEKPAHLSRLSLHQRYTVDGHIAERTGTSREPADQLGTGGFAVQEKAAGNEFHVDSADQADQADQSVVPHDALASASDLQPVAPVAPEHNPSARGLLRTVARSIIQEETIREVPLSAPGLHGIRLQVIEGLTGAGQFESATLQLVDAFGTAVTTTHQLLPFTDDGLTIVSTVDGRRWTFDTSMRLQTAELPLTGTGIGAMSGLSLRLRYTPDGRVAERSLTDSLGTTIRSDEVLVLPELADRLGVGGMPVEDTENGNVIHFDAAGQSALRDQRSETGLVRQELTDPRTANAFPPDSTGEIQLATQAALDPQEALNLLTSSARTDSTRYPGELFDPDKYPVNDVHSKPQQDTVPEEEIALSHTTQSTSQPGRERRNPKVTPAEIAIVLARVFAINFVADSSSVIVNQAANGKKVTVLADLRFGALDALGTAAFTAGAAGLGKGAGWKGALGEFLRGEGMLGNTANGAVSNAVGGLLADGIYHQTPAGFWQDAITNFASGAAANAGGYAFARALEERSRLDERTVNSCEKFLNAVYEDLAAHVMSTTSYTAGVLVETDLQNLHNSG